MSKSGNKSESKPESNVIKGDFPLESPPPEKEKASEKEKEKEETTCIGLVSPGEMGASVGAAAVSQGARVIWAGEGRSETTHKRARKAGLTDCKTVERMASEASIIISICPPHDAEAVAKSVIDAGFKGLYVEANAISPMKAEGLAHLLRQASIEVVDGGIVGGPAWTAEAGTRLYLSGRWAEIVERVFEGSVLETTHINDAPGSASAMKMCYAAYTKGTAALLTAILGVADLHRVRLELEGQWGDDFAIRTYHHLTASSGKAWRFVGEMREIADTFQESGMPGGFHLAAAEIYERLARFKDEPADKVEDIIAALFDYPP